LPLSGGEDYELLFTVPSADFDKIKTTKFFNVGILLQKTKG
jgi:thiamine monophosphate kinase